MFNLNKVVLIVCENDVEIRLVPGEDDEYREYFTISTQDRAVARQLRGILKTEFSNSGRDDIWSCEVYGLSIGQLIEEIESWDWNEWSHFRLYPEG